MSNVQAAAQLAESILQATAISHNPSATPQQRAEAVQFFEHLKHGEIHSTVHAAAVLTGTEYALEVQMSAYSLLQYLVRNRWAELSPDEHQKITQLAYQHMKDVGHLGQQAAWPLKSKAAMLLAAVTRQQGPETYTALLPQLIASAAEGPMQAEISCMVLQFVSEDITQFEERGGEWKRNYLAALLQSVETVLPFVVQLLQTSLQAGSTAASQEQAELARQHAAVVSAALGTLGGYVEWAPLGRLCNGNVVEACGFFLGVQNFRDAALAVVKQVVGRKPNKDPEEIDAYSALMAKVGDVIAQAAAALLAIPNVQEELGAEGSAEEYGRRLCSVIASFADNHWSQMSSIQQQHLLLKHMLEYVRHPHLPLATVALSFWATMMKEAGAIPGPSKASPIQSPRPAADGSTGRGSAEPVDRSKVIPPECCQLLVQGLAEQLLRLPVRFEDAEVPLWADSAADYKDAVGTFRSQAKIVTRAAAKLAPSPVLTSIAAFQQASIATATSSNNAAAAAGSQQTQQLQQQLQQGHMALEAAVILLESVLPSMCDTAVMAKEGQGLKDGLAALLQQLMALRYTDPLLVTLHARALEAFSKFISISPDLLVPLLTASFDCMAAIQLEQSGQLPPPAKVTLRWKEEAMARLSMSKVLLNVAKEAPTAFLPHLEALVQKVQQLWDAGQLREGEKVALHEGLMAAVAACDVQLQHQLLQWLLRPVHAKWSDARWLAHLESPAAFAAEYMQHQMEGGNVVVLSNQQRWSLHHELQLFERILRRTPPKDAAAAGAQQQQQNQQAGLQQQQQAPQQQQHPFTPHLEWSLIPVAAITRCLHGMYLPDVQAQLSPIAAAFQMDPVERALRVGGEREVAKKTEEDAGTIAGTNAPALRYWLRSIREGCYMIFSYAAQHIGDTLWQNSQLSSVVPQSLASNLQVMEDRHLRILLRHGLTPLIVHCPVQARPTWLLPILSVLVPLMHERLSKRWDQIVLGGGNSSTSTGSSAQQQQQQQLSDEVVVETLLREVTREYVVMLAKATERSGAAAAAAGDSTVPAAAAAATAALAGPPAALTAAVAQEHESVLETLWRYDGQAMQALMATAVSGMCWPDAPAAGKCTVICRFVAGLAESSHPELEALLLPSMLRSAMLSAIQVSSITIQPEVLHLLRQILVHWLPRSELIRSMLLQLPHVTPQVLASFQEQLLSQHSEKDQRALIRTLLAEAGGDQARQVLSAVSKVPVMNMPEPKAKPQQQQGGHGEADEDDAAVTDQQREAAKATAVSSILLPKHATFSLCNAVQHVYPLREVVEGLLQQHTLQVPAGPVALCTLQSKL